MPKKPAKMRPDVAESAFRVMREATGKAPKTLPPSERKERNAVAVERGRKGGKIGGKARSEKLSPDELQAIGRGAARIRWREKT